MFLYTLDMNLFRKVRVCFEILMYFNVIIGSCHALSSSLCYISLAFV